MPQQLDDFETIVHPTITIINSLSLHHCNIKDKKEDEERKS